MAWKSPYRLSPAASPSQPWRTASRTVHTRRQGRKKPVTRPHLLHRRCGVTAAKERPREPRQYQDAVQEGHLAQGSPELAE